MKRYDFVVHYHIYKNAGVTVDIALKELLGNNAHIELDKDERFKDLPHNRALIEGIVGQYSYQAFSSHRFIASAHRSNTLNIYPIIFLRHPLLRAASIYRYERIRGDDYRFKEYALKYDFSDWLTWALEYKYYYAISNYQTCVLSASEDDCFNGKLYTALSGELRMGNLGVAVDRLNDMPVVGIVENFSQSAILIEDSLQNSFPEFSLQGMQENKTHDTKDWVVELKQLEDSLTSDALDTFYERNRNDYYLFERYSNILSSEYSAFEKAGRQLPRIKS